MADVSISLPAKRRRGRPRKDGNLSREATLHSPENPTRIQNNTQRAATIYPTSDGLKNNNQEANNRSSKYATTIDGMVGSMIYGVIEGSFDAGYLISVRIGNNDAPFRGVVFQPKKFVPVTAANDVAPQARMYQRREITVPYSDNSSQISSGFSPRPQMASKQTVLRPVYYSNQSAFMLPDATMLRSSSFPNMGEGITMTAKTPTVRANQHSPPVHQTDEAMQAFQVSTSSKGSRVHGKFVESAFGPSTFTHNKLTGSNVELHHNFMENMPGPAFDIQRGGTICREMEHPRERHDIKTDLHTPTDMYYLDLRGPGVNFHQDLFTDQSQPNPTRLGHEFHQSDLVDSVAKSPNLKLDLASTIHEKKQVPQDPQASSENQNYFIHNEMKSPTNLGYHHTLVSGNPLLLPPEFTGEPLEFMLEKNRPLPNSKARQEMSAEAASSPSGPYKLELATPQSTVYTRHGEQMNSSAGGCITDMDFVLSDVVQPTEHQGDICETKHR